MENIKQAPNQFYVGNNPQNPQAQITFDRKGSDQLVIDHTYVAKALSGQGLAEQLVDKVACYARQENKKIIPVCPYAKKVLTSKPEYKDVLAQP